jgi:hypothetical protein
VKISGEGNSESGTYFDWVDSSSTVPRVYKSPREISHRAAAVELTTMRSFKLSAKEAVGRRRPSSKTLAA